MNFKNPKWVDYELMQYITLDEVPEQLIEKVRDRLQSKVSNEPLITVVLSVWNEEVNIIRCLDSISRNETTIPFDILIVDNNSKDRTQESIEKLGLSSVFQPIQGCGPAREMGQRNAKGKYILFVDADCYYPKLWIETMGRGLLQEGVVFVCGKYSFFGTPENPRWMMAIYEFARDIMVEVKQIRRPYLNAYGMSMGYVKEYGLKEGYVQRNIRGEDGRLCFDLMKYGKIKLIRSNKARIWTGNRTLGKEGTLVSAV